MVSRREIRTSHSVHFINRDSPRESRVTCEQLQLAAGLWQDAAQSPAEVFSFQFDRAQRRRQQQRSGET